jgi:putative tryptophan/tyrosine transport system substrate-binding protein
MNATERGPMGRGRLLLLGVLASCGPAIAGAAEVALLKSSDVAAWRPTLDAFRKAASGHTITEFDLRGDRAEGERVLGALKGRGAILVALGPMAAQVARQFLPDSPLIYGMVQDPGKIGLAGPTVSGVAFSVPVKNQLAAFRLVFPRGSRVGLMSSDDRMVQEAQKAGTVVRVNVITKTVGSEKDVPAVLRTLLKGAEAVDAIWIPADPVLLADETRRFILAETLKEGKPVFSFSPALVAEGALVSDGPDLVSVGEQLADLVNRTASGDKAAKGALLVPRAELVINKKIADKLRIEIPEDALRAANKVF